jgi:hypothetical protein
LGDGLGGAGVGGGEGVPAEIEGGKGGEGGEEEGERVEAGRSEVVGGNVERFQNAGA